MTTAASCPPPTSSAPCPTAATPIAQQSLALWQALELRAGPPESRSNPYASFVGLDAVVLEYGYAFTSAHDSPTVLQGPKRQCFNNALSGVLRSIGTAQPLEYCEGFAFVPAHNLIVQHAWLIDAHGHVVDPTWEDAALCGYVGVPVNTTHMLKANKARVEGHLGLSYTRLFVHGVPPQALQTAYASGRNQGAATTAEGAPRWA